MDLNTTSHHAEGGQNSCYSRNPMVTMSVGAKSGEGGGHTEDESCVLETEQISSSSCQHESSSSRVSVYEHYSTVINLLLFLSITHADVVLQFQFPFKLHRLLEESALDGNDHIVSWLPHGQGFKVHSKKDFECHILPLYYTASAAPKYRSFCRQLAIYNFRRCDDPTRPDYGAYNHPLLIRGKPDLCQGMTREKVKHARQRTASRKTTQRIAYPTQQEQYQQSRSVFDQGLVQYDSTSVSTTTSTTSIWDDDLLKFAIAANHFLDSKLKNKAAASSFTAADKSSDLDHHHSMGMMKTMANSSNSAVACGGIEKEEAVSIINSIERLVRGRRS
jgi:hypothetical protein